MYSGSRLPHFIPLSVYVAAGEELVKRKGLRAILGAFDAGLTRGALPRIKSRTAGVG